MIRTSLLTVTLAIATLAVLAVAVVPAVGQRRGRGPGGPPAHRGGRADPQFAADRQDFHFLLTHRDQIRREVTKLDNGILTLTESDDAKIAARIQKHVAAMHKRIKKPSPIHRRDPLFDELFRHTDKITMKVENTDAGVKVTETSDDPYVARLIQAHADVLSLFVKNGHAEVRRNHKLPKKE